MPNPRTPPAPVDGQPASPARASRPRKAHLRLNAAALRIEARLTAPACAALERLRAAMELRSGRTPSLSMIICEAVTSAAPPIADGRR